MAAIYGVVVIVVCFLLVQRDGYTVTASSLRAAVARIWGRCCTSAGDAPASGVKGGAYLSKVPPRYGYPQLLRNALCFWSIVGVLKVCSCWCLMLRAYEMSAA